MALIDSKYRIKIDMNYTTTNNAITATTNINTALAGLGRPETATRNNMNVYLLIVGLTAAEGASIKSALDTAWASAARSGGKVSLVRNGDPD